MPGDLVVQHLEVIPIIEESGYFPGLVPQDGYNHNGQDVDQEQVGNHRFFEGSTQGSHNMDAVVGHIAHVTLEEVIFKLIIIIYTI